MSILKTILVDDEISNIKGLRLKLVKLFPEIEIIGCYQDPEEAIEGINTQEFDLLFLDIHMPRINGFELLSKIKKINFQIIFVTAYSEYAIDAFKKNAIDYILKPVANEDLTNAVNKAITVIADKNHTENTKNLMALLAENITDNNRIIIPTATGVSFIPQEEVLHLEGYKGYTKIHLTDASVVTSSYNLGKFEKTLNNSFFKCHKSHIINLKKVRNFENEGYVVLDNNHRIPISKSHKKAFLSLF